MQAALLPPAYTMARMAKTGHRGHRENPVKQGRKDRLGKPARKAPPDKMGRRDRPAKMALMDKTARQAHKAHPATTDRTARRELPQPSQSAQ